MKPPRVVLVTRRFWPLVGGAERIMAELAGELHKQGASARIVTARWDPTWPAELFHRGIPVSRLSQPRLRFWGTWSYMRALRRWLLRHRSEFDLVYVSMLKHDAYVAVGCGRKAGFPVVLRAEGAGPTGDVHWQLSHPLGVRIRNRCYQASALVSPTPIIHRELIAAGYPRDRLHEIPNAVAIPVVGQQKSAARAALAEAHPLLATSGAAQVALYTGRLHPGKGLADLVAAWSQIARELPGAQLWLTGEGPYRDALARQIAQLGLDGRVVLTGAFDTVDELLAAADVFVLPSLEEGMSLSLLEAMAAGLPVVATDIPANRLLIKHERHGLLVPTKNEDALGGAILRLLREQALAQRLAEAARQRVRREFSLAECARRHLELFEKLVA